MYAFKITEMKAKDLIKILENVPEFDVVVTLTTETPNEGWGIKYTNFDVKEYNDTGHSDKVIMFEIEERT